MFWFYEFILDSIPSYALYFELLLGAIVVWIVFKSEGPQGVEDLSEKDLKVIDEFTPDPIVPNVTKNHRGLNPSIVENQVGKNITIDGHHCFNLATQNFLGLAKHKLIEDEGAGTIRKYGVGSCGPRGFYGTVDVHLELEERLAEFFGTEESVVYSYGFSTAASAIPAYAKRSDLIFVDECVNFSIQKGLDASRSTIKFFKHNDTNHLEQLLKEQQLLELKGVKKARKCRKFLVVEGIYSKTGNICPLPKIIELRRKYKLRLFIDESISFGTLGETGKGVIEYFNIKLVDVDLIMGSLEHALASVGGFCAGTSFIVEHQRLSSLGYCFSASLPPVLTTAAIEALKLIKSDPRMIKELQENSKLCSKVLSNSENIIKHFKISGSEEAPIKHLFAIEDLDLGVLQQIVTKSVERGVAVVVPSHLEEDRFHKDSIRISLNSLLTEKEIIDCMSTLDATVKLVIEENTKIQH